MRPYNGTQPQRTTIYANNNTQYAIVTISLSLIRNGKKFSTKYLRSGVAPGVCIYRNSMPDHDDDDDNDSAQFI